MASALSCQSSTPRRRSHAYRTRTDPQRQPPRASVAKRREACLCVSHRGRGALPPGHSPHGSAPNTQHTLHAHVPPQVIHIERPDLPTPSRLACRAVNFTLTVNLTVQSRSVAAWAHCRQRRVGTVRRLAVRRLTVQRLTVRRLTVRRRLAGWRRLAGLRRASSRRLHVQTHLMAFSLHLLAHKPATRRQPSVQRRRRRRLPLAPRSGSPPARVSRLPASPMRRGCPRQTDGCG